MYIGCWQEYRLAKAVHEPKPEKHLKDYYNQWAELCAKVGETEATKALVWSPLFNASIRKGERRSTASLVAPISGSASVRSYRSGVSLPSTISAPVRSRRFGRSGKRAALAAKKRRRSSLLRVERMKRAYTKMDGVVDPAEVAKTISKNADTTPPPALQINTKDLRPLPLLPNESMRPGSTQSRASTGTFPTDDEVDALLCWTAGLAQSPIASPTAA